MPKAGNGLFPFLQSAEKHVWPSKALPSRYGSKVKLPRNCKKFFVCTSFRFLTAESASQKQDHNGWEALTTRAGTI